ncbi:response regulator transcription factor [Dictyobacter aurantiacus]|uniref:DNA-binding response regulator n=1 Tax=Dictyobacter aurantiacus TaxID=1936993 RepID=A0A401Z9S3_9CHLR|nr:response regulator transcription factor [Dictyobacter aurantiacus]GCE03563.1 DNA-binding response regulator [Dictyobacter aurantiacus]
MNNTRIPVIVIDDTPVKRRGVCEFVEETTLLELAGQSGDAQGAISLVENLCQKQEQNPTLAGWMVLSDLRLGVSNGVELGRMLLDIAPGLRVVIYTQDPSWTLAAEVFRHEYTRRGTQRTRRTRKSTGLHGYALFNNMEPAYLEHIASSVVFRKETYIDPEVLNYLLKRLRGQRLTPRQEECASLIARGLSNDDIALRMGFLNAKGGPNIGPVENLVSELYNFFSIEGAPSDPGRRVLLAHAYEAYAGLRQDPLFR